MKMLVVMVMMMIVDDDSHDVVISTSLPACHRVAAYMVSPPAAPPVMLADLLSDRSFP